MKTTIFTNLVFTLVLAVLVRAAPFVPDENTVALWHLDGNADDASGNGNHLSVKTDRVTWVSGKYGQAALMGDDPWSGSCWNSDGAAMTAPGSGCTYPGSGDWTVEARVKFPSTSSGYTAVCHYSKHWAGHDPFALGINNGKVSFFIQSALVEADASAYVGQWVHIAGVYRYQQDISVYVNGKQVGIEPTTGVIEHLPNYDVFVGGSFCGTSTDLQVDEVRISNVARYDGDILERPFEWSRIADLPGDQHAACAAVIDGLVYMVGGQNPSGPPNYNKMRIYDPVSNLWSDGPSMSTRRYCPGSGIIEGPDGPELYVVGGYSGYAGLSTVERYKPAIGTWETVASITGRRGHGIMTTVVNNKLYAIGGFYNHHDYFATNEVYDRDRNVWVSKTPLPVAMQAGQIAVWNEKIYIFGGSKDGGLVMSTLIYDTNTDTWSNGTDIPRNRVFGGAVTFGDHIHLIGGAGGSPVIDVYDTVSDSWVQIRDYPGSNSSSPIIAQTSDSVYVLGDSYSPPGKLECWVGKITAMPVPGQWFVDDDAAGDPEPGNPDISDPLEDGSSAHPFDSVQEAIDMASDGDTVLVRPGIYTEEIVFKGKAITVRSTADAAVLEAPGNDAVSFYYGEGPNSVLKNFIIRNSAIGIFIASSSPTISNVTIVDNEYAVAAYGWSEPNITSSIFWNNSAGDLHPYCENNLSPIRCLYNVRYTRLQRLHAGQGNIDTEPLFADPSSGDYHLLSERGRYVSAYGLWAFDEVTSPCVDGGDPAANPGQERMPNGGRINMGAYGGTAYVSMSKWQLAGDINRNGVVDMLDFAILAGSWLEAAEWVK